MKMKKRISLILTAALALSACASAADSATTAATPEPTAAPEPVGELRSFYDTPLLSGDGIYQVSLSYDDDWNVNGSLVYKTDVSTGQTREFYRTDDWTYSSFPLVTDTTLYLTGPHKLLALPLDGGDPREIALGFDASNWQTYLYNDRYLYYLTISTAPFVATQGLRVDLQTGQSEPWSIPTETAAVMGPVGDKLLTYRVISDYPIPFPDDSEMSDALLQNSSWEYDLNDLSTGKPVQKLLTFALNGAPEDGGRVFYSYLGRCGEDLYFTAEHTADDTKAVTMSALCIHSDGTQEELGIAENCPLWALCQNRELRWIAAQDGSLGPITIYDTQGNEIGHNGRTTDEAYYPVCLLDDGRVLLVIGRDAANDDIMRYAVMDADAFLNGSTEYTEMEFVG